MMVRLTALLLASACLPVAGAAHTPDPSQEAVTCEPSDAAAVVAAFMAALVKQDFEEAARRVTPDAIIIFGRAVASPRNPLYGAWRGPEGATEVIRRFHQLLVPGSVKVDLRFASGDLVVLQGSMLHRARSTGKPFASDWALIARVCGDRVKHYQFYEDTAALEDALAPAPQ